MRAPLEVQLASNNLKDKILNLNYSLLTDYEIEGIYNKVMDASDYINYTVSKHPKDLIKGRI